MRDSPIVRKIKLTSYKLPLENLATDLAFAAGAFYEPGSRSTRNLLAIQVYTDIGVTGEYISITPATREQIQMIAPFLIGKNALDRELFYRQAKMILRKHDRMGIGPIDITLWTSRASFSMRRFTNYWAAIDRSCPATQAHTTQTVRPVG